MGEVKWMMKKYNWYCKPYWCSINNMSTDRKDQLWKIWRAECNCANDKHFVEAVYEWGKRWINELLNNQTSCDWKGTPLCEPYVFRGIIPNNWKVLYVVIGIIVRVLYADSKTVWQSIYDYVKNRPKINRKFITNWIKYDSPRLAIMGIHAKQNSSFNLEQKHSALSCPQVALGKSVIVAPPLIAKGRVPLFAGDVCLPQNLAMELCHTGVIWLTMAFDHVALFNVNCMFYTCLMSLMLEQVGVSSKGNVELMTAWTWFKRDCLRVLMTWRKARRNSIEMSRM